MLATIGVFNLFQEKKYFTMFLFLGMLIYFTLTLGANGNAARFKLPIIPFYTILASIGFVKFQKFLRLKLQKQKNNT